MEKEEMTKVNETSAKYQYFAAIIGNIIWNGTKIF